MVDILDRKGQHLTLLHALHGEVSSVVLSEAILREKEVFNGVSFEVVAPRGYVDYEVLGAEVLMHAYLSLSSPAFFPRMTIGRWVDDGKHRVVYFRLLHHKGTNAFDGEVKVVDHVASLVEIVRLSEQLLFQARTDPSQEILVAQHLE
jgi:hypothetical protein